MAQVMCHLQCAARIQVDMFGCQQIILNLAEVSRLQLILRDARHFVSLAKPSQSFIKLHGKVNLYLDIQYD